MRRAVQRHLTNLAASLRQGDLPEVLGRYSEILLALLVITIVGIMIVPLPTFVLDVLLTLNMAMARWCCCICALRAATRSSSPSFPTHPADHHAVPAGAQRLRHAADPAARATPAR